MRYRCVCSGIAAATVAWHPLGWECVSHAEIDPFPSAVLAHRWPGIPNLGDFTTIDDRPGSTDLLVGGTPCQSFSVAGLRKGLDDDRGNLALEFLRLADRTRPRWVVWENVPGVLSSGGGRDFGAFLGGLVELGYGFAYRVLDAQHFGVPQRRRRVFVVGCAGDWRRAAAVLFERHSLSGNPPPGREAGAGIAPAVTPGARRASGARGGEQLTIAAEISCPLTGNQYGDHESRESLLVTHTLRGDGFDASEDGTGRGTPLVPMPFIVNAAESCATQSHARRAEVARCIDSTGSFANAQGGTVVAFQERGREGGRSLEHQEGIAYSLNAPSGGGRRQELNVALPSGVRRLTPIECEKLQGFPPGYTSVPYRGKSASDGPRYKAIGNSMAVPVMAWIGRRIDAVEGITR